MIDARENAIFATVVILSMAITPLILLASDRFLRRETSLDGVEEAHDLGGKVLMIGFGRFGQIAAQLMLAHPTSGAIIDHDHDPDRIREAEKWGFKVFYGDGTRLDILHSSGAHEAEVIMVCVDDRKAANQIVELVKHEFPQAKLLVRSYDRGHSMELIRAGVDFEIRETVESAYQMGAAGLRAIGCPEAMVAETLEDIRRRDTARLTQQVQGDMFSGREHVHVMPERLTGGH